MNRCMAVGWRRGERPPRHALLFGVLLLLQILFVPPSVGWIGAAVADGDEGEEDDEDTDDEEPDDDDDDDDDDGEERWDEESHSYQVEIEEDQVEIEIESENASIESKMKIKIDLEESRFRLSFEEEAGASEVEQELELTIQELFEFEDANGDGLHDDGEAVLQSFVFNEEVEPRHTGADEVDWHTPILSDINIDGVEGERVDLVADLGDGNASFAIVLRIMTDPIQLDAGRFVPTEVKMDFAIDDWNRMSNTSRFALDLHVEAESDAEIEGAGLMSRHRLDTMELALGFSWIDTADIDGLNHTVAHGITELMSSEDAVEFDVQFGYTAGQAILHDPILGARYTAARTAGTGSEPGLIPDPGDQGNHSEISDILSPSMLPWSAELVVGLLSAVALGLATVSLQRRRTVRLLEADPLIPWLLPPPPVDLQFEMEVE